MKISSCAVKESFFLFVPFHESLVYTPDIVGAKSRLAVMQPFVFTKVIMSLNYIIICSHKRLDYSKEFFFCKFSSKANYCKCNFPMTPHVRLLVGRSICHNFLKGREFTFLCSQWKTCY